MGWRMSLADEAIRELGEALRLLGADGALVRHEAPQAPGVPVRFLLNHPNRRDEAIVNAYGVNALILTFAASATLVANPPKKFDQVLPDGPALAGKSYSIDAVLTRQVQGVVVAFSAYVKGAPV